MDGAGAAGVAGAVFRDTGFSLPVRILYVSIRSPLSLLCRNEYSPKASNLCSYDIWDPSSNTQPGYVGGDHSESSETI